MAWLLALLVAYSAPATFGTEPDPIVRTSHPPGSVHSANYPLSMTIVLSQQGLPQTALELWLDGRNVTESTQFKASPYTWHLSRELDLPRESDHSYELRVHYTNRADFIYSASFKTDVRGAGDFLIEAEDFNYGQGRSRPAANLPGYLGAAYEGLGAVYQVDYQGSRTNLPITDNYRQGESPNLTILYSDHLERSGYDLAASWIVVGSPGDWFNYTRSFEAGYYRVYAAVSAPPDGAELEGELNFVSHADQPNQVTSPLGRFHGEAGQGWGENQLIPLLAGGERSPKIVFLDGIQTLRYSVIHGALDYLVFVPQLPLELSVMSRNRIRLSWKGAAILEESSDPAGPFEPHGTITESPVELTLPEGASRGFFRLRSTRQPISHPSAPPQKP